MHIDVGSCLQPMLICPRTHDGLVSSERTPSFDNVRKDHGIQMANMGGSVDVEDGRRNVVWFCGRWFGRGELSETTVDRTRSADPGRASGGA